MLAPTATWTSTQPGIIRDVAWGDVDGDGDLDLAVANYGSTVLFLNENGALSTAPGRVWTSGDEDASGGVAWGDVDGDGDLDLAVASNESQNKIYRNEQGQLNPVADWLSWDNNFTSSAAWADVDGDGDMDLPRPTNNPRLTASISTPMGCCKPAQRGHGSPRIWSPRSARPGGIWMATGSPSWLSAPMISAATPCPSASIRPRPRPAPGPGSPLVWPAMPSPRSAANRSAPWPRRTGYAVPGVRQSGDHPHHLYALRRRQHPLWPSAGLLFPGRRRQVDSGHPHGGHPDHGSGQSSLPQQERGQHPSLQMGCGGQRLLWPERQCGGAHGGHPQPQGQGKGRSPAPNSMPRPAARAIPSGCGEPRCGSMPKAWGPPTWSPARWFSSFPAGRADAATVIGRGSTHLHHGCGAAILQGRGASERGGQTGCPGPHHRHGQIHGLPDQRHPQPDGDDPLHHDRHRGAESGCDQPESPDPLQPRRLLGMGRPQRHHLSGPA